MNTQSLHCATLPFHPGRLAGLCLIAILCHTMAAPQPVAPEENLAVIRVVHRDAGDIARIAEDLLNQTLAPEERARGAITVDPKSNLVLIRAGGPGATWPATVRSIARELDKPSDQTEMTLSLWRRGWAAGKPQTQEGLQAARQVLGDEPGEKLDEFKAPMETGSFAAAWLEARGESLFRVIVLAGPIGQGGTTARLIPVRIEALGLPVLGGVGMGIPSPPSSIPPAPGIPSVPGALPDQAAQPTPIIESGNAPQSNQPPVPRAPAKEEPFAEEPFSMLPPPIGDVVFAGPINCSAQLPTMVGPFTLPGQRGQYVIAIEIGPSK